jgi:hypothetical protein
MRFRSAQHHDISFVSIKQSRRPLSFKNRMLEEVYMCNVFWEGTHWNRKSS